MSATYRTAQGDTLDYICWKHYRQLKGTVEVVLKANPGLADLGAVIPENTLIQLPDMPKPASEVQPIRLWG